MKQFNNHNRALQCCWVLAIALLSLTSPVLAQLPAGAVSRQQLDELAGQPVDIAPWAYAWRADLAIQERPEAYFIPRRLDRIDKVYRTAAGALPPEQLKSVCYNNMPDLLKSFPPPPNGRLQAALLWTGRLSDYQVELHWPQGQEVPSPENVEVRVYPTSYGWFGWTVDKILSKPEVSADRLTWTYRSQPGEKMDFAYDSRIDAATEMTAVFYDDKNTSGSDAHALPSLRVTGPNVGNWKRMDVEIEWGFDPATEKDDFKGRVESHVALLGAVLPLPGDACMTPGGPGTTPMGEQAWQSKPSGRSRRGVSIPLLYAPDSRPGLDSRLTIWTATSGCTIRLRDLDDGPILIPGHGLFVTKAGAGKTAQQFSAELAAKGLKSIRQMTREHREAASLEEVMREVRLSTCPPDTPVPPLPKVPDSPMHVQVPDPGWTYAWRAASHMLTCPSFWGTISYEVSRVAHAMDMVGMHDHADKVYQHFLKSPGVKIDGDYTDGRGSLEWATSMRNDMAYSHDGSCASTGRMLFCMLDRYFLTGDQAWFKRHRTRLQEAADWIIRQRTLYMKDIPNRQDLQVAGLMPPYHLSDYALPASDRHWYFCDNAFSLQALQRLADALADFDPEAAKTYAAAAEAFRQDIRRAVDREAALAPVRRGIDGACHGFIAQVAYAKGLTCPELGAPSYPDQDLFIGALPLAEPFAALEPNDPRMIDTLNALEELAAPPAAVEKFEQLRAKRCLSTDDAWFWRSLVSLPKVSHNANIYLLQDDVPNFLRFWANSYASLVGADGGLWEHWHLGSFENCAATDNGTTGWFIENFRNLLVMEDGQSLWVARATPRAWLEQGKNITVKNAPTYFGTLAYEIISDVDNGKITASIEIPGRKPPENVIVRFRHPKALPIKSVTVNGKPWTDFDQKNETVRLHGVANHADVQVLY